MTRRGTLVYYLAAWVCGSFFLALSYFLWFLAKASGGRAGGREFLLMFFYGMMMGFLPLLLAAFFLRRLATSLRLKLGWQWTLAGTVLLLGVTWTFGRLWLAIESLPGAAWWKMALLFVFVGPGFAFKEALWPTILPGAATAFILHRVHRAFDFAARGGYS